MLIPTSVDMLFTFVGRVPAEIQEGSGSTFLLHTLAPVPWKHSIPTKGKEEGRKGEREGGKERRREERRKEWREGERRGSVCNFNGQRELFLKFWWLFFPISAFTYKHIHIYTYSLVSIWFIICTFSICTVLSLPFLNYSSPSLLCNIQINNVLSYCACFPFI